MAGLTRSSIASAVLKATNDFLAGLPGKRPRPLTEDDGWEDTNATPEVAVLEAIRRRCQGQIVSSLGGLGIPAKYLSSLTQDDIAEPGIGSGYVSDLIDFCFRTVVSVAVRSGIQTKLGLPTLPEEDDGWEKPQDGQPSPPDTITRKSCDRAIRSELNLAGIAEVSTDLLETTKLASPGKPPKTIQNVVDYCYGVVKSPPGPSNLA